MDIRHGEIMDKSRHVLNKILLKGYTVDMISEFAS